jgi:hypothetical protein
MPNRWLSFQEFYPVRVLQTNDGSLHPADGREFTDDELSDLRRIQKEWFDWQIKIAERFGYAAEEYTRADYDLVD